jgi:lysophospholipase L1-like esterase
LPPRPPPAANAGRTLAARADGGNLAGLTRGSGRATLPVVKLRLVAALAGALLLAFPAASPAATPKIYLSLGDSLAAGYLSPAQPISTQGYADQLLALKKAAGANLTLKKLGCPGETTTQMISGGGHCPYARGSQLKEAVAFLKRYGKRVAFVTIDIGANDILPCNPANIGCTAAALGAVQTNFPRIIRALRQAAGPDVKLKIASMTYYAPGLALWLTGPAGQAQATAYVNSFIAPLNAIVRSMYSGLRVRTAAVDRAFSVTDFTTTADLPGVGTVPLNVAKTCTLTSMCTQQNIHPNAQGYGVIAQAFAAALR